MPGNYVITNRADGEGINAIKYMADHQQHVDNLEPPKVDDYSSSLTEMRSTVDPGEVGSESQATSLAGELERLRHAIREIKGTTYWYETPAAADPTDRFQTGDVKYSARATASTGWLLCDGSAISRTTYAPLFAAIGTTFGAGDGVASFNLPPAPGRTIVAAGQGSGLTFRALGAAFGEETHVLQSWEAPSHTHGVSDPGHSHYANGAGNPAGAGPTGLMAPGVGAVGADTSVIQWNYTGISILANAGGGTGHNNIQPSLTLNLFIKT